MDRTLYFPLDIVSDKFLQELLWDAQEMQDIKYYRAIKEEMNRRIREQ